METKGDIMRGRDNEHFYIDIASGIWEDGRLRQRHPRGP